MYQSRGAALAHHDLNLILRQLMATLVSTARCYNLAVETKLAGSKTARRPACAGVYVRMWMYVVLTQHTPTAALLTDHADAQTS